MAPTGELETPDPDWWFKSDSNTATLEQSVAGIRGGEEWHEEQERLQGIQR